ncbi:g3069 [Coccomyxa elongata]
MNYNEKLTWTFAAIAAASGGVWLYAEFYPRFESGQTQQILSTVLVFWVVALLRSVMTFVWGFGVRKPEVPVTRAPIAGAKDEVEGDDADAKDTPVARRRTRTRRDI